MQQGKAEKRIAKVVAEITYKFSIIVYYFWNVI